MFKSLFRKDPSADAGDALHIAVVEQARQVEFYEGYGVPDTTEGRFEMVVLHAWLVLRRLKSEEAQGAKAVSQKLFDAIFADLDASLREMGVGDMIVGKKIRKLAENFYGRMGAYEEAIDETASTGQEQLAKALARNVYEASDQKVALRLSNYVRHAAVFLKEQPQSRLVGGLVRFPAPGDIA